METQQVELIKKAELYERLCELYPKKTSYLQRYAELLIRLGRNFHAQTVLQHLHGLLLDLGDEKQAEEVSNLLTSLEKNTLSSHPYLAAFFQHADTALIDKLFARHKRMELKQGEYLIRQGEKSRSMYIVLEGELSVWRHLSKDKEPILIHNLEKGDTIGEIAFIRGEERTADVLANCDCTVLKLTSSDIMKQMLEDPAFESAMHAEVNARYHMTLLSQNPEFHAIPIHLRRFLAESSKLKSYGALTRIAAAGKPISFVGVVAEGKVSMALASSNGKSQVRAALSPGDMFGESAVVADAPGSGSLTHMTDLAAVQPCKVLFIPLGVLRTVINLHPPLKMALVKLATQHMNETIQLIREMSAK